MNEPVRIMFKGNYYPDPLHGGAARYFINLARHLNELGYKIYYVFSNTEINCVKPVFRIPDELFGKVSFSTMGGFRIGRYLITPALLLGSSRIGRFFLSKSRYFGRERIKVRTDSWITSEDIDFSKRMFDRIKPKVFFANYAGNADVFDFLDSTGSKAVLKLILTHDVMSQRVKMLKKSGIEPDTPDWGEDEEKARLDKADVIVAIQKDDEKVFRQMLPGKEVVCAGIAIDAEKKTSVQKAGRCLYVGTHSAHNYYGLDWFLTQVWASILIENPLCTLRVAGSIKDKFTGRHFKNVEFLGSVTSLENEYAYAQISVMPLPLGSGLKIKLVEALAHGKACVSTSAGLQGLDEAVVRAVIKADSAKDFCRAVCDLLKDKDKRQSMEEEAVRFCNEQFSPEKAYLPLTDCLNRWLKNGISDHS